MRIVWKRPKISSIGMRCNCGAVFIIKSPAKPILYCPCGKCTANLKMLNIYYENNEGVTK